MLDRSVSFPMAMLAAALTAAMPAAAAPPANGFALNIGLSEKAAGMLRKMGEAMVVSASYAGKPKPDARKHVDESGRIDLGNRQQQIAGAATTVQVEGTPPRPERMRWVDGAPLVNVNVFSARRSGPDNILSCDFVDAALPALSGRTIDIHCALITENVQNAHKS